MRKIKAFIRSGKNALIHLLQNDPLRMAGATAFFTIFALPPILILLVQVFKWIIGPDVIRHQLFLKLSDMFGVEAVRQLVGVLKAIRNLSDNPFVTIGGFIFLLFVITTLFRVFKNSINQLWQIKSKGKVSFMSNIRSRLQALLVLMVAGILFITGFAAETLQALVGNYIFKLSPQASVLFNMVLTQAISITIITCWFTIVFRYLPDGRPAWRIAWLGGFITSILFAVGKSVMHTLLTYSNVNTIYGTSASIVLLLLFVFYSALILYYGASFTWVWARHRSRPIKPLEHAVHYKLVATDVDNNAQPGM